MSEIPVEAFFDRTVVEQLRVVHSQIAALQAEEIALMTQLYQLRRAQQLDLGVGYLYAGEDTATEIGIALKMSQRAADLAINLGLGLDNRYPATREAFAAGRIDLAQARAISQTLTNVSEDVLAGLETKVAAYAEQADPARIRRTARRWLLETDPEGEAVRRKGAEADRYVSVTAADNGTAVVDAVLPAAGGQTLYERLREMASTQVCGSDPRTTAQRRADALVALADGTGRLTCQCGRSDCPRAEIDATTPAPRKALVQVGVSAETLAGLRDNPALLAGFGAIDADLARQLARYARFDLITDTTTAQMTVPATEPHAACADAGLALRFPAHHTPDQVSAKGIPDRRIPGQTSSTDTPSAETELRYRPGARVAARVRALDGTCRAPGCQIPAAATDLDHQDRFDHNDPLSGGHTTEDNLGARCRRHHRLKTHAENHRNQWRVLHHPNREVEWVTPTGQSVTTQPEGVAFLFPTRFVAPVTAGGVPDAEPHGSVWDPGEAENEMTEMLHVYSTPAQRRGARRAARRARGGSAGSAQHVIHTLKAR
ncbi:HNH endonuclease signature motif containing protein [Nocardia terrae]|nr:HNH endonuclease signature motif containing protein [Nocardia terrae]